MPLWIYLLGTIVNLILYEKRYDYYSYQIDAINSIRVVIFINYYQGIEHFCTFGKNVQ